MGLFVIGLRRVVLLLLILTATASLTAQGAVESERAKQNLSKLADALSNMHPGNADLARRVADLKEKLSTLTPEQLSPLAPQLSGAEFTAAVDRLANAGTQTFQQSAAQIMSFAGQGPLPGAEYDSCGDTRSDTDQGRNLVIASDSLALAAIGGDVVCNTVVTILGEGTNLPGCIAAGVLHVAAQATQFELDLRSYCDSVIDSNEIRGILNNTTVIGINLASHDADIKTALAQHDTDIKALLAILQKSVDEANQRLKVSEALERQTIKLLLTPEGLRTVDPAVMTCTGDNCPKLVLCPGPECSFALVKK